MVHDMDCWKTQFWVLFLHTTHQFWRTVTCCKLLDIEQDIGDIKYDVNKNKKDE